MSRSGAFNKLPPEGNAKCRGAWTGALTPRLNEAATEASRTEWHLEYRAESFDIFFKNYYFIVRY